MKRSKFKQLVREELNIVNPNQQYTFTENDLYYITQNIPKILDYFNSLNISTPEHIDRKKRLNNIFKIISKVKPK